METIYWITRLDGIIAVSVIISIMFFAAAVALIVYYFSEIECYSIYDKDEDDIKTAKRCRRAIYGSVFGMFLFMLIAVFVPTTKDAIIIYGCGSILEYIEQNDKIQEMPDRLVNITDKYISELERNFENKEDEKLKLEK